MTYARLIDGELEYPVYRNSMLVDVENGVYILNPKHQHYIDAGYKVLVEKPIDIPEKEGYIIVPVYHEEGDEIIQEWTYEEAPETETDVYDGTDEEYEDDGTDESSTESGTDEEDEDTDTDETSTDEEEA